MKNLKRSLAMILILTTVFSSSVFAQELSMEAVGDNIEVITDNIETEEVTIESDAVEEDWENVEAIVDADTVVSDVEPSASDVETEEVSLNSTEVSLNSTEETLETVVKEEGAFSFAHEKYIFKVKDHKCEDWYYPPDFYEGYYYEKDPEENVNYDVYTDVFYYQNLDIIDTETLICNGEIVQSCKSADESVVTITEIKKNRVTIRPTGLGKTTLTAISKDGETTSCIISIAGTKPKFKYSTYNVETGAQEFLGFDNSQFSGSINIKSSDTSIAKIVKVRPYYDPDDDWSDIIDQFYVKGVGQGTVTITLTAGLGRKATTKVNVVKPITDITVPRNIFLNPGQYKTIKTTITPADSVMGLKFSSSNTSVATVNENGKVKAIKNGTATITVKDEKNRVEKKVKVYINTTGINKTKLSLYRKDTEYLHYFGSETATWSSSDPSVAKVSTSGKVTAVKKGTATITAKVGKTSYTCEVTVKNPKLSETSLSLKGNGTAKTLTVTGAIGEVTWSSSNTNVAKVSSSGKVTPRLGGTATITALANGVKLTCKVTVSKVPSITLSGVKFTNYETVALYDAWFKVSNNTNKKIKSLDFMTYYYDYKGNPVYDKDTGLRTKKLHFEGPFSAFKKNFILSYNKKIFNNDKADKVKITYITINYANGTKEEVRIWKTYKIIEIVQD